MEVFPLIRATFRVIGRAAPLFLGIGVMAEAPNIILVLAGGSDDSRSVVVIVGALLGQLILLYSLQPIMTVAAAHLLTGESWTPAGVLRESVARALPNLGAMMLSVVLILVGFVCLIVPGLIMSIALALVGPACVLDRVGPVESLRRSARLTEGHRWHIFGMYVVFHLPSAALTILSMTLLGAHPVAKQWVDEIVQIVWQPLGAIFAVAIYLAVRPGDARREEVAQVFE